jgi:hypothetical protein
MALIAKPMDKVRPDVPVQEVTKGDMVRFNFFISSVTLKALKTEAFTREVSVGEIIREALESRRK